MGLLGLIIIIIRPQPQHFIRQNRENNELARGNIGWQNSKMFPHLLYLQFPLWLCWKNFCLLYFSLHQLCPHDEIFFFEEPFLLLKGFEGPWKGTKIHKMEFLMSYFFRFVYLLMDETLGIVSVLQIPSRISLSLISQANIDGHSVLYL